MTTADLAGIPPARTDAGQASRVLDDEARAGGRLFFADHMRVALTALVVIHHLAIAFAITIPGLWYYEDATTDRVANVVGLLLVLIDQAFFMGAFFLIAGYFTPASYDRKRAGGFLRDRAIRLLVPLMAFALLLGPLAAIPAKVNAHAHLSWRLYLGMIHPGPMWFVEVLFLLCCGYAVVRLLRRPAADAEAVPGPATPTAPTAPAASSVLLFILALAAATFVFRLAVPVGKEVPVLGLPTPAYLPQYVGLFAVGVLAARRGWFRSVPDWMGWAGLALSAVATVVLFLPALATSLKSAAFVGGMHWQAAAYALWDSTLAVGMFLGLLVIFRRWANRPRGIWNELSRSQYGVYVLHPPILVGVTLPLVPLPLAPLLKLLLAIAIALPLCFTLAGLVRRLPGVARVL